MCAGASKLSSNVIKVSNLFLLLFREGVSTNSTMCGPQKVCFLLIRYDHRYVIVDYLLNCLLFP